MENNTPKPEKINIRTVEEIENEIRAIDLEIVKEEVISPARLKEICVRKLMLSREVAILRGEKIKKGSDTSFS